MSVKNTIKNIRDIYSTAKGNVLPVEVLTILDDIERDYDKELHSRTK